MQRKRCIVLAVICLTSVQDIEAKYRVSPTPAATTWVRDVAAIVQSSAAKSMLECSVIALYDSPDGGAAIDSLVSWDTFSRGVVVSRASEMSAPLALSLVSMKNAGGACTSVLLLCSLETWKRLLAVSTVDQWAGNRHILVLLSPVRGEIPAIDSTTQEEAHIKLARDIMMDTVLRKTVQLIVGVYSESRQFWSLLQNSLYNGDLRYSLDMKDGFSGKTGFRNGGDLFPSSKLERFDGYVFTIAALPYSPFIIENQDDRVGPGKYSGLEVMLIDTLAASANFSYKYKAPADGEWGQRFANGTWTGMIGLVDREEADWAVSDISFSAGRARYVDFSIPFVYDASELLTPRALPLPRFLGPIKPFTMVVWLSIALGVAASGPMLSLIVRLSPHPSKNAWFVNPANAATYILNPIFMRGTHVDVTSDSSRVFAFFWLLSAMIVSILYSSSLTSFLILPGFTIPIQNLEQLVTSEIGWGKVNFGGVQNAMLEQTRDPVLMKLREGVQWRSSLDNILKDVVAGTLATWDNRITTRLKVAVYFTDKAGQPLVTLTGFELLQERVAWPMTRDCPFKRRFDQLISRARQAGLVDKWLRDVILEQQAIANKEKRDLEFDPDAKDKALNNDGQGGTVVLSLDHFQGAYFVLTIGYLCGAVTLLAEFIAVRFRRKCS